MASRIASWKGHEIVVAESRGGILAVPRLADNLIATGVSPWPPPEIAQRTYRLESTGRVGGGVL
jgi:hypothetical protein